MAVYVDRLREYARAGRCSTDGEWCHLATDGPIEELHAFARALGLPRMAFHAGARHPHYDLRRNKRDEAVAMGAIEVTSKELVRKCFRNGR